MVATSQQLIEPLRDNEQEAKIVRAVFDAKSECLLLLFLLEDSGKTVGDTIRLHPYPQLDRLLHLAYAVGMTTEDGPPSDPLQLLYKRVIIALNGGGDVAAYYRLLHRPVQPIGWDHFRLN